MIWSEIRAQGWKYGAYALVILLIASTAYGVWQRGSAAAARESAGKAKSEARASKASLKAAREAAGRDDKSTEATNTARNDMEKSASGTQARIAKQEVKTRDRSPVPVVCPEPDADLVREHVKGSAEVHAAESRLRSLRSAEGSAAK